MAPDCTLDRLLELLIQFVKYEYFHGLIKKQSSPQQQVYNYALVYKMKLKCLELKRERNERET